MANSGRQSLSELVETDGHLEELSEFLEGGGDPNQNVHDSVTLLHVAAQSEPINIRAIEKLINAGADINSTTGQGHTPLQFAIMRRNLVAVQSLLEAGARINDKNNFGRTALHYAVYTCLPNRLPSQLMYEFDIWPDGMHSPDLWIIKKLLEHDNTDVNPVDSRGETPLMWAVRFGFANAVNTLLKEAANPNISNQSGRNCLHVAFAAPIPNKHIITDLLLNGTNIYDVDNSGKTPIDILLRKCRDSVIFLFAKDWLSIIAFKYRIRLDLGDKVRRIPALFEHLKKACQEVERMNKQMIYDKVTLHDFASNCFPEPRTENAAAHEIETYLDICKTVVVILLYGSYEVYLRDILNLISKRNLCTVLESIFHPSVSFQSLMTFFRLFNRPNYEIFLLVKELYREELRNNELLVSFE